MAFEFFDKCMEEMKREEPNLIEGCKHEEVMEGCCTECYEIVGVELMNDYGWWDRSSNRGEPGHNRELHFDKFLYNIELNGEMFNIMEDLKKFEKTYKYIDTGSRNNFLLN